MAVVNRRVVLGSSVLMAVALAAGLAGCSGGGGGGPTTPVEPQVLTAIVWVAVPSDAEFSGFDLLLAHDPSRLTAAAPLAQAVAAWDLAGASTCQGADTAASLRLACASDTVIRGPGRIARFEFTYTAVPRADAFDLTCHFVDSDGNPVAVSCTAELVY